MTKLLQNKPSGKERRKIVKKNNSEEKTEVGNLNKKKHNENRKVSD